MMGWAVFVCLLQIYAEKIYMDYFVGCSFCFYEIIVSLK